MDIICQTTGTGPYNFLITERIFLDGWTKEYWNNFLKNYTAFSLDWNKIKSLIKHDFLNRISYKCLDKTFKNSTELQDYYEHIRILCLEKGIKTVIFWNTWQYWHPEFLKKLHNEWIILALVTADDDSDRIKYCSLPYTRYYDFHFHCWVMYDTSCSIAEKLRAHGSRNPVWIPLWASANHINANVDFYHRDIEVCYIGSVNPLKFFRLSKLKKHFWDRFKLYGSQWNGDFKSLKGIFYWISNKIFRLWYVEKLSDEKLLEVYWRTKIGFNMHLVPWKWPSNCRMYELPANGIMQICDNSIGLNKIFKIWEEVLSYEDMDEAIEKIEYFLWNKQERIAIAKAWHKRAIREYRSEYSFQTILNNIFWH